MDKLIVIIGPTASGKTALATQLAYQLNGAIISADSRQVYRNMDIGTGKDLNEFRVNTKQIPYYLIDICEAGEKYNLARYQKDFETALTQIKNNNQQPIVCGGTGLYIEAVLNNYNRTQFSDNIALRLTLLNNTKEELLNIYKKLNINNLKFDTSTNKRIIRAIEILSNTTTLDENKKRNDYLIFGVDIDRESRRKKITKRLTERLNNGMIEEVQSLLAKGIPHTTLEYYGLEYKYVSKYLQQELTFEQMHNKLNTEIHRYAKRQMTWYRRMERNGFKINWIPHDITINDQIDRVKKLI